jgi:nucleotide-binding universal stress UspA family protein
MTATPVEFKRIVVATDFEPPAKHALDVALVLAEKLEAEVTLLHVQYVPRAHYDVEIVWPSEQIAASAQRAIDAAVADAKQRYARCRGALRVGSPAEHIIEAAKQLRADLVVMGTHGRQGALHGLLGSVAERVVRTSPVPVLTVGPEREPTPSQQAPTLGT